MDVFPEHRQRTAGLHAGVLASLARIDRGTLGPADRTTHDVLAWIAEDRRAQLRFPDHLLPIDQQAFSVPFVLAAPQANGLSALATARDFELHLDRLRCLPAWCDQAAKNLREGVRGGVVHSRAIYERLIPMVRKLADASLQHSPYLAPLHAMPASISPANQNRLRRLYQELLRRQLSPALQALADTLEADVLPKVRPGVGWSELPDGAAWYARWVSSHTSTALTPPEIHAMGLKDVDRLRGAMRQLQARSRHVGSLTDFLHRHDQRPQTRPFRTAQEVLDAYGRLNATVEQRLPGLFGRLPKAQHEIRPEPELTRLTASDHYVEPALDGSRPGVFYAVIPDPVAYATSTMTSLFLHEGQPGHHLQVCLAQESALPDIQRFYFHTAYGEGWALYAETLGYDLGLYADSDAELGHLTMAMMRAVRLVVDTGLHALGWSRERAAAYFQEQTGFDARSTRVQIERYMVQPGQALSYATGRMTMERLRDDACGALGSRFALADFHDRVIDAGALPMSVLEAKLRRWIDGSRPEHVTDALPNHP